MQYLISLTSGNRNTAIKIVNQAEETHFRTLIELARPLEDTGLRLITNHEDEEEEED